MYALKRIIYGKPAAGNQRVLHFDVLALTDGVTAADMPAWRALAPLEPLPDGSQAVGLFAGPSENCIFARAHEQNGVPIYGYTLIPRPALVELEGNLAQLLALFFNPIPSFVSANTQIEPLEFNPRPWTASERQATFETFLSRYAGGDIKKAVYLLAAMLDERALMIYGFAPNLTERLLFVQGLLALLPSYARAEVTFSTRVGPPSIAYPHLIFIEDLIETPRHIANYATDEAPDLSGRFQTGNLPAYCEHLLRFWDGNSAHLLSAIDAMPSAEPKLLHEHRLSEALNVMVERHKLDMQVMEGNSVPLERLETALNNGSVQGDLRRAYVKALFKQSLEARDAESACVVANEMDVDPQLNHELSAALETNLDVQPDAVYSFVRARLACGNDARWQQRLQTAALCSLQVAITDGDTETLLNWLKLVAREPQVYGLNDVLHQAILAARERARSDGDLGKQLIMLAVKRDPASLDVLLEDEELMQHLPSALAHALREFRPEAVEDIFNMKGRELYLAAMARAAQAGVAEVFDATAVERIWAFYISDHPASLPGAYQPEAIVQTWMQRGANWLLPEARETLVTLTLFNNRDAMFYQLAHGLMKDSSLTPPPLLTVVTALKKSKRSATDIVEIVVHLVNEGDLTVQQAINVYAALLNSWEWRKTALPVVEQLARTLNQSSNLSVPADTLWHLLQMGEDAKSDLLARVAARYLFALIEAVEDEAQLTADLLKMYELLLWNSTIRQLLMHWWRDFVRREPLQRLLRLEKALEGKRSLEEARGIVQTAAALRKLLGKRSLRDVAEDIQRAYTVLETLAESFDPSPKHEVHFDQITVRDELHARESELTPQERTIMANNFKELAQLIATMGDNRSKSSLVRRDPDRQLMTGEQQPQSAVDVLKWLAGYLSGAQERDVDDDE
ncbi:MAG: hypothetical protein U0694_21400 [Anaerolineae bacterium]